MTVERWVSRTCLFLENFTFCSGPGPIDESSGQHNLDLSARQAVPRKHFGSSIGLQKYLGPGTKLSVESVDDERRSSFDSRGLLRLQRQGQDTEIHQVLPVD